MEPAIAMAVLLLLALTALPIASFVILLVVKGKLSDMEGDLKNGLFRMEEALRDLKRQTAQAPSGRESQAETEAREASGSQLVPSAPPFASETAASQEEIASPASDVAPAVETPSQPLEPLPEASVETPRVEAEARVASEAEEERKAEASALLQELLENATPEPSAETSKSEGKPEEPAPKPSGAEPSPAPQAVAASSFERGAEEAVGKIWNWILVGEEREGVSLEYAVATTWLVRGAIATILASLVFGINYSIKNGFFPPELRVALGFVTGLAMLGWGLWLAKGKYRAAAQGLIGGGLAALYFCSFAASSIYHLIGAPFAFCLMGLTTAGCCVVALSSDSLLIALIGTLGGYATPLALSSGEKNLPGLFAYMSLLGLGLLFVALKRDWKLLVSLSMLFSYALYSGALWKFYDKASPDDYSISIGFGAFFFLVFSLSPLLYNLAKRKASTALELLLALFNSAAFFAAAYALTVSKFPKLDAATAVVSLSLAAYNVAFAYLLRVRRSEDKALFLMLYAFASFFVAFSVPLLLGTQWIGAAWSLQALAMLWLARRLGGAFLPSLAYVCYALAAFRLLAFDLPGGFHGEMDKARYLAELPARLGSFGSFVASLFGAWLLLRGAPALPSEEAKPASSRGIELSAKGVFVSVAVVALVFLLHFELVSLSGAFFPGFKASLLGAVWTCALLLSLWLWRRRGSELAAVFAALFGAGLVAKLFLFDLAFFDLGPSFAFACGSVVERATDFVPAIAALFAGFLAAKGSKTASALFAGAFLVSLFCYASLEIKTLTALFAPGFSSGAVSVFWGLFALGTLFAGILRKALSLRAAGLFLFLATVLKIFLSDLASLSQPARVAAFFALGVATLAGAFVYMRFRSAFEDSAEGKDGIEP